MIEPSFTLTEKEGHTTWVRTTLAGREKEYTHCSYCEEVDNCEIRFTKELAEKHYLVKLVVWECPRFKPVMKHDSDS